MAVMHPLTLSFKNKVLVQLFLQATLERSRHQGRLAIIIGMLIYTFHGILDQWYVSPDQSSAVWATRLTALCVPTVVFIVTFTPWFARLCHPLLATAGLAAGLGLVGMQVLVQFDNAVYFYPTMVLATFYTYNFVGTRFIYALGADLFLLLTYNLVFGLLLDYPGHILFSHDYFIISANLIGGSAGYLAERQRRLLFIRERELDQERQHHLNRSLHDGLTGLPNRELLYDRINQAIAESEREGSIHCGFFLDLDGFKLINDQLGHKVGDQVLRDVAQRLKSAVRGQDTVARIGGDEFFVLALDIGTEASAHEFAKKLLAQFDTVISEVPVNVQLSTSIGLCLFPYPGMTVSDMMHRADEAMYQIKNSGKGNFAMADMTKPVIGSV